MQGILGLNLVLVSTTMFLLSTVVLAASIYLAGAYSSGAPSQACNNLTPGHVSSGAQTDAVPYVFDLSQFDDGNGGYEYTPGQSYTRKPQSGY